jgi:hypothetical protein
MNEKELKSSIAIILKKELINQEKGPLTWSIKTNTATDEKLIEYEHANALIEIYTGLLDASTRKIFIDLMIIETINGSEKLEYEEVDRFNSEYIISNYYSSSALSFFVLLQLGFILKALEALSERIKYSNSSSETTSLSIMKLLTAIFSIGNNYFSLEQVNDLIILIDSIPDKLERFNCSIIQIANEAITNNGYILVKNKIDGINIEINRDKTAVLEKVAYLMFDKKYSDFLNEVDNFINTSSSLISSGMVGNMRSFMEEIINDLAKKIASLENEEIPYDRELGHMGNIRKYIKIKLELTDADNQLINKYIEVLHSEGGHAFISNIEYFRLAKNIGIEIVLFLLKKYESKYSK